MGIKAQSKFFLPGDCKDPGYKNIRDLSSAAKYRIFIEDLWHEYEPYADRHFLTDAPNHFLQRFWEMYVCVAFLRHGLHVDKASNEGPEFFIEIDGLRIWIEAIAPTSGDGQDYVPKPQIGEVFQVPLEKVILRYTSALLDKLKKYNEFCRKRLIRETDCYVVAINSRGIQHALYGSVLPYHVHAFLPFGNLTQIIDRRSLEITKSFFRLRDNVKKLNGSSVSTKSFLEPEYAGISAVIHSTVDCANGPSELGADFDVLHNPSAKCAFPRKNLNWCRHRIYNHGKLEIHEPFK